jgi:hypothetical protein
MRMRPPKRRMATLAAIKGSGERGWGAAGATVTVRVAVVRAVRERWAVPVTEAWTRRG